MRDQPGAGLERPDRNFLHYLHDRQVRAIIIQATVFAAIVALLIFAVKNTAGNLSKAGITSGFGFLEQPAGFDISQTLIEYSRSSTYGRAFLVGLLNTLVMSVVVIAASTVMGFLLGITRLSGNWLVSRMTAVWIDIIRNIPLLLQIFFWYIAILSPLPGPRQALELGGVYLCNRGLILPRPLFLDGIWVAGIALALAFVCYAALYRWARQRQKKTGAPFPVWRTMLAIMIAAPLAGLALAGFPVSFEAPVMKGFNFQGGLTVIPEFTALALSLTLYASAFIAENVRAGIESVSHGQQEASHALGLRPGQTMRLIIIPQAMRVIIPPLTSQHLTSVKNSSLAVVIGYPDLISVFAGTTLNQTGQAVEVIAITMLVYLTTSLLISGFMNWYNRKMAIVER
jgi:general L-amino acid transport system permease protein